VLIENDTIRYDTKSLTWTRTLSIQPCLAHEEEKGIFKKLKQTNPNIPLIQYKLKTTENKNIGQLQKYTKK